MHRRLMRSTAAIVAILISCVVGDDDGTTDPTNITTTDPTGTTSPSESSGMTGTTMPAETSEGSTGEQCPGDAECQEDADCGAGGTCVACLCIGGMDSTDASGGDCPDGETCQLAGNGMMVCLAEPDHCVLACGGDMMCPASMTCQNGACQYDVMNPPAEGDASYPLPAAESPLCPEGHIAVSFGPGKGMYAVCSPACDGTGQDAACPQAASGTAVGACLFNPDSSTNPC